MRRVLPARWVAGPLALCAVAVGALLFAAPAAATTAHPPAWVEKPKPGVPAEVEDPVVASATAEEQALTERFAPVMKLVTQKQPCGPGEPYLPSTVDVVFDNPTVALRGPWDPQRDLVKVGPSVEDVSVGLPGYSLDLPGDPLDPACVFEKWAREQWGKEAVPTAYGRVATQPGVADRIAVQYFFFYPFNDYNNKHEVDWERIQLEFEAPDAAAVLDGGLLPERVVYSQHYGSEWAAWGDSKLEVVGETHPVVYVSAGSHANQFSAGVFLGNSAVTGFGCDITAGDHTEVNPEIATIPFDQEQALAAFPWTGFRGHWGEVGPVRFYEGPTGPNLKRAWNNPFVWSADARPSSIVVPGSAASNTRVSEFYCSVVGKGSDLFRRYVSNSPLVLAALTALLGVLIWLFRRTDWRSTPFPLQQARGSGQVVYASWQLIRAHRVKFLALAAPMVTIAVAAALVQTLSLTHAIPTWLVLGFDVAAVLGLLLAAGAVTVAIVSIAEGRPVGVGSAYARGARRLAAGSPALAVATLSVLLLTGSLILLPVAVVLLGAWSFLVSVIVLEPGSGLSALRRSLSLVRRSLSTTVPVLLLMLVLITTAGALLATVVFIVTPVPFLVLNAIPAVTLAIVWPFICMLATYNYFSAVAGYDEHRAEEPEPVAAG